MTSYRSIFDWNDKHANLKKYIELSESPDFWDDNNSAQKTMKTIADLRSQIENWETLGKKILDFIELSKLEDSSFSEELENNLIRLSEKITRLELTTLLPGPYDKGNALLTINAGAGGTDAQDWAEMLLRMYLRWAEKSGFTIQIIEKSPGEEAGIKSITVLIEGQYAYGYLRAEKGVHRLVRLSPFDAAHRRHTSFVQVEVLPEVTSEDPDIEIKSEDLEIDVYKSSGAGGQNVQKNSTAVRIRHLPSDITVSCQNERSLVQNRENAMKVLRGRLYEIKIKEQEKEKTKLRGVYQKTEWGSQIRSYVLHPYQMVKDHRTGYENGNAQAVLDGDITDFIEEYLKKQ